LCSCVKTNDTKETQEKKINVQKQKNANAKAHQRKQEKEKARNSKSTPLSKGSIRSIWE